jgi:SAM-dependent methyltransferase
VTEVEKTRIGKGYTTWFHDHSLEEKRLNYLAEVFDPASVAVLGSLGIEPHWRCLDLGTGHGSVAAWLARQAHDGTTTACDVNTDLFAYQTSSTLQLAVHDVTRDDFPVGSFQLIHSRFLLQHLAAREQVLDRMVSWLAPDGWLVVADAFDVARSSTEHPHYAAFYEALYQALPTFLDTDCMWGRRYPEPLVRRGLTDISMDVFTPPVHGGGPFALHIHESLARIRPAILAGGVEESLLDRALADLRDPNFHDLNYALVIARGRKPVITH